MIEKDLVQYLNDGLDKAEAVFYLQALQDTQPPYVVIQLISPMREYSHQGYSRIMRPRIQIDCYARDKIEAKELAQGVIDIMHKWPAHHEAETPDWNETSGLYRITLDFFVAYYDEE